MQELANDIINAEHAGKAKGLSKSIPTEFRQEWERKNTTVMQELINIKSEQVPEFRDALLESDGNYLAESTSDRFWASGLSPDITEKTAPGSWPGLNTLGKILMQVRNNVIVENEQFHVP